MQVCLRWANTTKRCDLLSLISSQGRFFWVPLLTDKRVPILTDVCALLICANPLSLMRFNFQRQKAPLNIFILLQISHKFGLVHLAKFALVDPSIYSECELKMRVHIKLDAMID